MHRGVAVVFDGLHLATDVHVPRLAHRHSCAVRPFEQLSHARFYCPIQSSKPSLNPRTPRPERPPTYLPCSCRTPYFHVRRPARQSEGFMSSVQQSSVSARRLSMSRLCVRNVRTARATYCRVWRPQHVKFSFVVGADIGPADARPSAGVSRFLTSSSREYASRTALRRMRNFAGKTWPKKTFLVRSWE